MSTTPANGQENPRRALLVHTSPSSVSLITTRLLSIGYEVKTIVDVREALAALPIQPDLLVVGGSDGIGLLKYFRVTLRDCPILYHAEEDGHKIAMQAYDLGADAVIVGAFSREQMLAAVGRLRVQRQGNFQTPARLTQPLAALSQREREVVDLIVGGRSNKEAARVLGISPRTVEVHRAHAMEKVGARNTAELIRRVLDPLY